MPQKPFAPPYDVLTNLLTEARRSAELTQRDLATRLAIGQSAVSKVERGVQRLDLVELHRWLDAIKGPTFLEFASAFDERIRAQSAAEVRWRPGRPAIGQDSRRHIKRRNARST
jgi:transcriptional regulator with XRE-family HTH domain